MTKQIKTALIIMICVAVTVPAYADMAIVNDEVSKTIQNLTKEMEKMRQTIEAQNTRIQILEQRKSDGVVIPQSASGTGSPVSEKDFQDLLGKEIKNYKYFKNLKMGGDFRLRYEAFDQQENADSLENRNRFRYRLRYGIENGIGDDLTVGFRLASATLNSRESALDPTSNTGRTIYAGDPTSTNQTFGNPGLFSFNTIAIEKAYAKYVPKLFKDLALGPINIKAIEIGGGKFENPHLKHSSPMVWDSDVTPEGVYEKIDLNLYQSEGNEVNLFGIAMQSPLKESNAGGQDAQLFSAQAGIHLVSHTPLLEKPVEFTSAFAAYQYNGYADNFNFTFDSASTSLARGNTGCVGAVAANGSSGDCTGLESNDPRILNFYNELKLAPANFPISLFSDVATNINNGAVSGDAAMKDTAWGLGTKVGGLKKRGDWEMIYGYYQIPPNAVVGAFSDSDFGQGYANNLGSVVKAGYQLTDSMALNFAWMNVRPYADLSSSATSTPRDHMTNRFQADMSWKF